MCIYMSNKVEYLCVKNWQRNAFYAILAFNMQHKI